MATAYKTKNENVEKAAAAEEKLNEIRTALEEKAKTGDKKAEKLLKKFDAAKEKGEEEGRQKAIKLIQDAIKHDPSNFILSLFKDLEPNSSYSSLDAIYHELQQLINKSDLGRSLDRKVELARALGAKNISEQEQTFIDKIKQAINDGNIKDVVAWMTMTKLLNEYVLESADEKGNIKSATATEILQNALDKFTHPGVQTQSEEKKNPSSGEGQKQGSEEKKEEKQPPEVQIFATGAAVSELFAEVSKSEKSIEDLIKSIKEADPKLLQKANAAILQFSAELQAILNKVDLSKEEREQLQKLQEQLNSAVEEKAKELNVSTKTLTVSDKHLKATEEHIDNLINRKEEEYKEVITKYHDFLVKIFAEEYNIPEESIDETLEERISRHTALGRVLRKGSNEEKAKQNIEARGFGDINPSNQNKQ